MIAALENSEAPGVDHIAVIDIGSNSVRLVVYRSLTRTPVPIYNEKTVCALGQGVETNGCLNPEGVQDALVAIGRFVRVARAMGVAVLDVVATAAVRDASDGLEFVREVHRRCGVMVSILTGEEEAAMTAMGVLCGVPDADGTVADLGGGSLELVAVDRGQLAGPSNTTKLGMLRLEEASGGDRARALHLIDKRLAKVDWLDLRGGRPLYAVGGIWRALARLFIAQVGHPLQVLDSFTLDYETALPLLDIVSNQSRKSIEKVPGLSRKRLIYLPLSSLLLLRLMERFRPSKLIFSVYGMREGRFFEHLPAGMRERDPLISFCQTMAQERGRFPEHGAELLEWINPVIINETPRQTRLRYAACLLSDLFWDEHPDYRAEQAFLQVFRLPFMGLSHQDRAFLALAVYYRYEGDFTAPQVDQARELLSEEERRRANVIGLALRLGHSVSAGVPGLLKETGLSVKDDALILTTPKKHKAFDGDFFERRGEKLTKTAGFEKFMVERK